MLLYTAAAMGFFLFNILTPIVRPELYQGSSVAVPKSGGTQKNYFVIGAAVLQIVLMWWLGASSYM